jgi:tetratricopeptide (TPR) repeat protein
MRSAGVCLALLVMIAPCPCLGQAAEQKPSAIDSADRLFQIGEFAQAGEQYARIAADAPDNYSAILQLGRIALLSNHLDDAKSWLERAIALRPGDRVKLAESVWCLVFGALLGTTQPSTLESAAYSALKLAFEFVDEAPKSNRNAVVPPCGADVLLWRRTTLQAVGFRRSRAIAMRSPQHRSSTFPRRNYLRQLAWQKECF